LSISTSTASYGGGSRSSSITIKASIIVIPTTATNGSKKTINHCQQINKNNKNLATFLNSFRVNLPRGCKTSWWLFCSHCIPTQHVLVTEIFYMRMLSHASATSEVMSMSSIKEDMVEKVWITIIMMMMIS